MDDEEVIANDKTNQAVQCSKKFIISLFGESGVGKTTVLLKLIEKLRQRARYNLEVADGFQSRDRRTIMWYRTGKKYSGAVCVCTSGDTREIIQSNIDFFTRHFDVANGKAPWNAWCNAIRDGKPVLSSDELKTTRMFDAPIGLLVTAARKPLRDYGSKLRLPSGVNLIDVPVRIDVWHGLKNPPNICDWMSAVFVPPEVLLFKINYLLRNDSFKEYSPDKNKRVSVKAMRSNISRDN